MPSGVSLHEGGLPPPNPASGSGGGEVGPGQAAETAADNKRGPEDGDNISKKARLGNIESADGKDENAPVACPLFCGPCMGEGATGCSCDVCENPDVLMMRSTTKWDRQDLPDGAVNEIFSPPRVAPHAPKFNFSHGDSMNLTTNDPDGVP